MMRNGNKVSLDGFDTDAGARNLLETCIGVKPGETVLLIGENGPKAFFDPDICGLIAKTVTAMGAGAEIVMAPEIDGPDDFPAELSDLISKKDHTIFCSRIGDQVRFSDLNGAGSKTMCYVRSADYLGDAYARVPYSVFVEILPLLMDEITAVDTISLRCPKGTDLTIDMRGVRSGLTEGKGPATDFTVKLFPILIYPPVTCAGMTGKIALGDFLMSTSTTLYDDSLMTLKSPLIARVETGRIVGIDGDAEEVNRVESHLLKLADDDTEAAFKLNSWHTGIYPPTFYRGDPGENIESWADIVFGNPRYTHIHMCGADPGHVALSLFDTDIEFDGVPFWKGGEFTFLQQPKCQAILEKYNCPAKAFETCREIGI
ncbi:MAG: hypothetical protein RIM72_02175 [Alphaproteobacteria bacterium]